MGLFTTLSAALRSRGKAAAETPSASLIWLGPASAASPIWADASDPMAYALNCWVYACVNEITSAVASADMLVDIPEKAGEWVEAPAEHGLAKLLEYVNQSADQFTLLEDTSAWLTLYGSAFWRKLRPRPKAPPTGLQVLPPNCIKINPGKGNVSSTVESYELLDDYGKTFTFSDDDIVHIKLFGNTDPAFGQSPIKVLERVINTYSASDQFTYAFYKGGGFPSVVLVTDQVLQQKDVDAVKARYAEWAGGAMRRGEPFVTGQGVRLEVPGVSPDNVTAHELPVRLREEICAVLRVPPALVGIYEYANYANVGGQRRIFYSGPVMQYWRRIAAALKSQLCPDFGVCRVRFDTGSIAALQPDFVEISQAAQNMRFTHRPDEIREKLYGDPPIGGDYGQSIWGSFNEVPLAGPDGNTPTAPTLPAPAAQPALALAASPASEPEPAQPKALPKRPKPKQRRLSQAARVALWKAFNASRTAETKHLRGIVEGWYDGLSKQVIANLQAAESKGLLRSRVKVPSMTALLFDLDEGAAALAERMVPALKDLCDRTGQQAVRQVDVNVAWSLRNPRVDALLQARELAMKTVAQTAQDRCRAALTEGLAAGENIDELTNRVMEWSATGKRYQAENVARTETGIAMNQATLAGYTQAGASAKEWLSIVDERSRPWHASMDGTVVGIDEKFVLETGEFDSPGDPEMDAEDICECFVDRQVPILTSEGWKEIGDVAIGDRVLTHRMRFKPVTALLRSPGYSGDVVKIAFSASMCLSKDRKSITVTPGHPILTQRGWVPAGEIAEGDTLQLVGLPCIGCGKPAPLYLGTGYCGGSCGRSVTAKEQWTRPGARDAQSLRTTEQLHREYGDGTRDRNTAAVKAREASFEKYGPGGVFGAFGDDLRAKAQAAIVEKYGSHLEHLRRFAFPALGRANCGSGLSRRMAAYLSKLGWDAIPEYPIGRRRADFYVPDRKLFIECDGQTWHQDKERDRLRDIEILRQYPDHTIARVDYGQGDRGEPKWKYRTLETLNHEGQYATIEAPVTSVERWSLRKARTRFNLAVAEDESYVAKGIVVHNCRCALAPVIDEAASSPTDSGDAELDVAA